MCQSASHEQQDEEEEEQKQEEEEEEQQEEEEEAVHLGMMHQDLLDLNQATLGNKSWEETADPNNNNNIQVNNNK